MIASQSILKQNIIKEEKYNHIFYFCNVKKHTHAIRRKHTRNNR